VNDVEPTYTGEVIAEGEWAGWRVWGPDPFELLAGPFFARKDAEGRMVCAFRAKAKHMNGHGAMHGGALMTFADYALFAIASEHIKETSAVTVQLSCEFIGAAHEGELIEARGDVVRAGGSLVFLRGVITADGRPALGYSAVLKKLRRR
jgi:uncharacterized protein (TIGR00369 family)